MLKKQFNNILMYQIYSGVEKTKTKIVCVECKNRHRKGTSVLT